MEKTARKLARKICEALDYDNEKEQIVAYGLIALFQITATVLGTLAFGFVVGTPVEALIICFSVSILRKYSGGAHAGTILLCTIIAIVYSTAFSVVSSRLLAPVADRSALVLAVAVAFFAAFYIVYKKAPVDTPQKPIKTTQKKKRMRKCSFLVLTVYLFVSLLLCLFGENSNTIRGCCISLLFGVAWQVFTLTKLGVFILGKTDHISKTKTT